MVGAVALIGCERKATAAPADTPPEVSVITVATEPVAITREYPARTYVRDQVEVRGRVDGYIERRAFAIGSDVAAGQVLYVLDSRPYAAVAERARGALAQATADVTQAEASLVKAQQDVQRLAPLVEEEAAARQDLDNATAALQVGRANVASKQGRARHRSRRAAERRARPRVRDHPRADRRPHRRQPAAGGRAGLTQLARAAHHHRAARHDLGALPVEREASSWPSSGSTPGTLPIELLLNDGRVHPAPGEIVNTLNSVNTRTGTLEVQARFANPDHSLLPGQFGRVRIRLAERAGCDPGAAEGRAGAPGPADGADR